MKKSLLALAVLGAFANAASAQSSVTLYGSIDDGIARVTNTDPAGNTTTGLGVNGQGWFGGSRLGFKGTEDLGNGLNAHFQIEDGFVLGTGRTDQQGQLFGRQAYVGIGGSFGSLDLGRQYTSAYKGICLVDPIGCGNITANSWQSSYTGVRFNNALTWSGKFGPVGASVQHTFNGVSGSSSALASTGGYVSYESDGMTGVLGFQKSNDGAASPNAAKIWYLGGAYTTGPLTLNADYIHSQRDANFGLDIAGANWDPAAITHMVSQTGGDWNQAVGAERTDKFYELGGTYAFTPALKTTLAYMYGKASSDAFADDAVRKTWYMDVDYALSKRTDTYIGIAQDKGSGGASGIFSGNDTQSTFMVGMRHAF
jgi:predicted porin